jgi:hypothetical protein
MLKFKNKKGTDKEFAHTEIYLGSELLGYFMPNKSKYATINENWNFVSKSDKVQYFHSKTKKELLDTLHKQINKQPVKLSQHFGIVTELNCI